ncbi:glycosyltransferase family 2 protein [Actinomyces glycerinitolerans]|uniref:Nucleotide-diphospho-sugar transferases n=1 Tax=Actinomyces glycerinitolerans TaxID=1892869 RepID=A0A1M4S0V2_9ACTO|nr:glycosyltransferase family 2 protein [Actinomyces glycerinitolerans]SHE25853.1 nucleotide-diphospho-sugar transferases [Actinomyces glycerinitolerans]
MTASPLITVVVPAYNAEDCLGRCLSSLVAADDGSGALEIIVVDDGATDGTGALADAYAAAHTAIEVIHQENKGHGGAINTGVAASRGTWLKVCDADDAIDPGALRTLLAALRSWQRDGNEPDLVVTNFVYVREGTPAWYRLSHGPARRGPRGIRPGRHVVRFRGLLPSGRIGGWDDVGRFRPDQYLMMHSLAYRREVLQRSGMRLPEHCFYVDNLFAFEPLRHVRTLTYLDLDLYYYTVGRAGQSVADDVIVARLDQHDRVNALMLEAMPHEGDVPNALLRYLVHIYTMSAVVITTMALRSGTPRNIAIKQQLWERLDATRPDVARRVRRSVMGRLMTLPGRPGDWVPVAGYQVARRVLALN